jgi:hypothetical protein
MSNEEITPTKAHEDETETNALTAREAAEYAKVDRSVIYKAFRAGCLGGKDFGGSRGIRTSKEAVRIWVDSGYQTECRHRWVLVNDLLDPCSFCGAPYVKHEDGS